jgi:hypothetical protein
VMTRQQYNQIRTCLHPDRLSYLNDAKLTKMFSDAFTLFNELELVLLKEKDYPTSYAPLPETVEELMRHRRASRARANGAGATK